MSAYTKNEIKKIAEEIKVISSRLIFGEITLGDATARLSRLADELNTHLNWEL